MRKLARADEADRRVLFTNTAAELRMRPEIVEKDFWVCYTLDYLFHRSSWKKALVFKGGTSLSKVYHAIQRFSEDIDLILDWRLLNYKEEEPWEARSRTGQAKFNDKIIGETAAFLKNIFVPAIQADISDEIGNEAVIAIDKNDQDQCTVNFYYPQSFTDSYMRPEIRLEIGPLAEWTPSHNGEIRPFAAEIYPDVFQSPLTEILTIDIERTFWEKATILHKVACGSREGNVPPRYSRHYYDVYALSLIAEVKENAFRHTELLEKDIVFKDKFYHSKSASYETARPSTIRLVPDDDALNTLYADYEHMKHMMFGEQDRPAFDRIIAQLELLEKEIHAL